MNKIIILLLLVARIGHSNAQDIIIDNSGSGGIDIPFQDTSLTSFDQEYAQCSSFDYFFDLDQDAEDDVKFHLNCYMGGFGGYYKISVSCLGDFSVHTDTCFIEHFQYIDYSSMEVHDTTRITPIVRKYVWGDTIYNDGNTLSKVKYLLYYSSSRGVAGDPECIYNNIGIFDGDTSYIAFSKPAGDTYCTYYFKIYIPNKKSLELISLKTNDPTTGIIENELVQNKVFPNPVSDILYFNEGYDVIEIYSLQGALLVREDISEGQNSLGIAGLSGGVYFVRLAKGKTNYVTKLIKQNF